MITDTTFSGNTADYGGGIVVRSYASINRSSISGNQAHVDGGGIFSETPASPS